MAGSRTGLWRMADYELLPACKFRDMEYVPVSDAVSMSDIAVLKSEVAGLHTAITEVAAKMDLVLDMHVKISVQNERLEQVVAEIGRVRDNINKEIGSLEVKTDNLATHSRNTRDRLDAWLNRIVGGTIVAAVAVGFVQYMVLEKLAQLDVTMATVDRNSGQVEVLQRTISDHISEFERTARGRFDGAKQ